ncbi:26S proteasome non-ATPase regulatory subunit 9-like [Tripterygium wilfordii]|uniref:26S proteasome non-ATPase regulatory subunit 9-like n=1 Tax=Tripterygium wilfordii TaxID=458696 RepID=UPI0018F83761|nr:26S proteasome non-ATPase regulatory subunit 9-like [Tripterygium wilfordii]XP_038698478.1 26S proteasome non-ATPase regulatory subunit 9-like [Tripterygium wilfordii]
MVGTNLKAETMSLMEKRTAMEVEMNAIIERLCQPGGPGLSGNLVDSEGFPRSDIDVPVVRAERHRLTELRNDHKEITEKINANIQVQHSARHVPRSSSTEDSGDDVMSNNRGSSFDNVFTSSSSNDVVPRDSLTAMDVDVIASIPFAVIDGIADASPAAVDGLQLGDQIIKFGNVDYQPGENFLQMLASETQSNQGQAIPVVAIRQGAPINLAVTPRTWQGRGLLGCNFRIL